MYAFMDRALERLDSNKWNFLNSVSRMQEFGTLRIDGGRQTGKSSAAAEFASRWRDAGNDIIVISTTASRSREMVDLIKRKCNTNFCIDRDHKGFIVGDTIRSFLSEDGLYKYRGLSITRVLVIIDEPIKLPDMMKFYEAYNRLVCEYVCQGQKPLPLFFVIGLQ